MDKEKLLKAGMWLSVTVLIIAVDANLLFLGFNHLRHDSYAVIIIAVCLLPVLFFCAYKGIKSLLDAIFS
jgi:divalent metal cation (Fe/Co/Zn/Cd) transporter